MTFDESPEPPRTDSIQPVRGPLVRALLIAALVVGAAMLAATAIIHLYLWGKEDGYRAVKTIGPLFFLQGIAGCVLAIAVVLVRRFLLALAGAGYMAASIAGLYKATHGGIFDFQETTDAPWVQTSFLIEYIGLAAYVVAMILLRPHTPANAAMKA